jgi:RsiW-degrading membrane proteinase PrsW (M82 family)
MIILYALVALFIAWIWVDYFRLIDVFEKEQFKYYVITFALGCASVYIVKVMHLYWLNAYDFQMNGEFLNDFLFCFIQIGAVEEFAKLVPFLILLLLFPHQLNEPVDYLIFICISALGFSAIENIMYFQRYGPELINGRAILSTVGHMFDTALIAYGIILYKYHEKKFGFYIVILFFVLAALSHGIYDFFLMYKGIKGGIFITILYFLITISLFATILNNALNHSDFFTYGKVVNPSKVSKRMLSYYAIVFILQFLIGFYKTSFFEAFSYLNFSIVQVGIITVITVLRLSRFKLIKNRWHKLKIELPFTFKSPGRLEKVPRAFQLRIKGDAFNESYISSYYENYFFIRPLRLGYSNGERKDYLIHMDDKVFIKFDTPLFHANLYNQGDANKFDSVYLKPKLYGKTRLSDLSPIVAILKLKDFYAKADFQHLTLDAFTFHGWAYFVEKPLKRVPDEELKMLMD